MSNIKLFQNQEIRSVWDAAQEQWLFSVIDVVGALSASTNPRKYWSVLKTRLNHEGSQLATNCSQLKMRSADGKSYLTDVANTKNLLRLIQSIPLKSIEVRKELTDEWQERGVKKGPEFAMLTDEIIRAWSGLSETAGHNKIIGQV